MRYLRRNGLTFRESLAEYEAFIEQFKDDIDEDDPEYDASECLSRWGD